MCCFQHCFLIVFRFPDTVIARVFSVGLKEFWSAIGDDQSVTETGQVNLQKIPKINSVVGILDHLASADHTQEVKECLKTMVCDSIQQYDDEDIEAGSEEEEQSLATVPYLLYLAKMSNVVALALTTNIYEFVTRPGVAERLSEMVADWAEHYFPGQDALPNHIVNLVLNVPGVNGRDAFRLLLDLGGDIFESNTRAGLFDNSVVFGLICTKRPKKPSAILFFFAGGVIHGKF